MPGQFSRENCEPGVDDYIEGTIAQLGTNCWRGLMKSWGKSEKPQVSTIIGESSRARRQLYLPPSSPEKA